MTPQSLRKPLATALLLTRCDPRALAGGSDQYTLTELPPLPGFTDHTWATDLNNNGELVGALDRPDNTVPAVPCLWRAGRMIELTLPALGEPAWAAGAHLINDAGQIVGEVESPSFGRQNVLWNDGVPSLLPFLPVNTRIRGLNNLGHMAVEYGAWSVGRYDGDQVTDLGLSAAACAAINDAGQIAGLADPFGAPARPFVWSSAAGVVSLPTPPPNSFVSVRAINAAGQVGGALGRASTGYRPVIWTPAEARFLELPPGFSHGIAHDLNSHNEAVGAVSDNERMAVSTAALWRGEVVHTDFLPPDLASREARATDINEAGQILVTVTPNSEYQTQVLLTPIACNGLLRGDANCDGAINFFDIDPFITALLDGQSWSTRFPDCNWLCNIDAGADGYVSFSDIDPFITRLLDRPAP